MSELAALLGHLVAALDAAGIPFMIAGSFASSAHGLPRATQDLDIVIDPASPRALDALLAALPRDSFYADRDVAHDAYRSRSMFNVVDHASGWKVDFIIRKHRPFSVEEFQRRVPAVLLGVAVFLSSPEDTILAKLEWSARSGGSERQRRDVAGILAASGEQLDRAYVERWVDDLGLRDEWTVVQGMSAG